MNLLARREKGDIFPVSGGFKACTVGADMSKATVGLESFSRCSYAVGVEELAAGGTPDIGFVDVEGQGDRHQAQDILLATPLLILSKMKRIGGFLGYTCNMRCTTLKIFGGFEKT